MAIAALLDLKHESPLSLKRSRAMQKSLRYRIATPRIHLRTPGRKACEMSERSQNYSDQQNRQNSDRPPPPTLFAFSRKKWQQKKKRDDHYGANKQSWRLHGRRQ